MPSVATATPASSGPMAPAPVKPTLMIALPSRSNPCGFSTAAAAARVSARAPIASVPSTAASSTTSQRAKLSAVAASATNVAASARYSSGSIRFVPAGSTRATST